MVLGKGQSTPAIPIGRRAKAIPFLHAADVGWRVAKPEGVAKVNVRYDDGSTASMEFRTLVHLTDWRVPVDMSDAHIGWQGYCIRHDPTAVYVHRWDNPRPDRKIIDATFTGTGKGQYILVAMTLEE